MLLRAWKLSIEVAGWIGCLVIFCTNLSAAQAFNSGPQSESRSLLLTDRMIVKLRPAANRNKSSFSNKAHRAISDQKLHDLNVTGHTSLTYKRTMSEGEQVLELPYKMSLTEARGIAKRLLDDPDIEYAEPDRIMVPYAVPNDPGYANQWNYMAPASAVGGANLPGAWDITTGNAGIVVAIVDTGLLPHSDIDSNILDGSGRVVPGYDFISSSQIANDGDGRDADPTDAGDWITSAESSSGFFQGCAVHDSSWHGTHVAGTIGAESNNGFGVAGINWTSKILPVRALGKCGGYESDIAEAIRWAAGLAVSGVPANANPAKIINLSLGGSGVCGSTYQDAITAATAAGAVVVVAAGNSGLNMNTNDFSPANCNGVITVAATDQSGGLAYYSNYGTTVEISGPGGEDFTGYHAEAIYSTLDGGATTALNDNAYAYYQGTSMAAPHISGIASLMMSANYTLTNSLLTPAQILSKLQSSARNFPGVTSGYAPASLGSDVCNTSICGAGLADAEMAVKAVSTAPTANAGIDQTVNPGAVVNLDGTSSSDDGSISAYTWLQISGTSVILTGGSTATPSFTVPSSSGVLSFQLTVTDDVNISAVDTVNITVNGLPTANAGIDQSVSLGDAVSLDGSGSHDVDGSISAYAWTQTAGTAVSLSGATTAAPSFTAPATAGTLSFQLQVTDNLGATATDSVNIVVNDRLTARAGNDQTARPGDVVTLDGSGSTSPNGPIVSYSWKQTDGPIIALSNASLAAPAFTAPSAVGTMTFQLSVIDGNSDTAIDTVSILMLPPLNQTPVTNAGGDQTVTQGDLVILNGGASSDPDGSISSYRWEQISGVAVVLAGANTVSASFTAPATTDILTFRLWATDNQGLSSYDIINIIIKPLVSAVAPIANAGPNQTVAPGSNVTLDASASSDADGSIVSYSWMQTSGGAVTINNANIASPNFTAPAGADTLTFRLTVTDNQGISAIDTVDIIIFNNNAAPIANAGLDRVVNEGDVVTLNGSASSDSDGSIAGYLWRQTSGTSVALDSASIAAPTFTAPNVSEALTFQLSVTDDVGATAIDTVVIVVNGPPSMGGSSVNGLITKLGVSTNVVFNVVDPNARDTHTFYVTPSSLGVATFDGNVLNYQANDVGAERLTVTVMDDHGASDKKDIIVTVNSADIADSNNDGVSDAQAKRNGLNASVWGGDSDEDGVPDADELGDPSNPTDSDGDGIIDALEIGADALNPQSLHFVAPNGAGRVSALSVPSINDVEIRSASGGAVIAHNNGVTGLPVYAETSFSKQDDDYDFPYGIYDFSVAGVTPGGTSAVTIRLSSGIHLDAGAVVRKLDINNSWQAFPAATINRDTGTISLILTDNDMFDTDPRPGIIHDPVGLGVAVALKNASAADGADTKSSGGGGAINPFVLCFSLLLLWRKESVRETRAGS